MSNSRDLGNYGTAALSETQTSATDTTAGALMEVGAFGLGGAVPLISSGDVNDLTVPGKYFINATGVANNPNPGNAGLIDVTAGVSGTTRVSQTSVSYVDNSQYLRSFTGIAWSDWHEIITANAAGNVDVAGLTVSGPDNVSITQTHTDGNVVTFTQSGTGGDIDWRNANGDALIRAADSSRLLVAKNGDISFYEDTGTTTKFFWDASAESLGIGTSSPTNPLTVIGSATIGNTTAAPITTELHVHKNVSAQPALFGDESTVVISTNVEGAGSQGYMGSLWFGAQDVSTIDQYGWKMAGMAGYMSGDMTATGGSADLLFYTAAASQTGAERMRIDSSGNVGIGTTSPDASLDVFPSATDNAWNNLALMRPDISDGPGEPGLQFQAFPSSTVVANRRAGIQAVSNTGAVVPLVLNKDGGNCGIGTTSPKSQLHVAGQIQSTEYLISNSGTGPKWSLVGVIDGISMEGGHTVRIRFNMHSGYNAQNNQDYTVDLIMKTDNGAGGGEQGQFINSWWYKFGNTSATPKFKWLEHSPARYSLYMYVPSYSSGSHYVVEKSSGTWIHDGNINVGDPGPNSPWLLEAENRLGIYSPVIINDDFSTTGTVRNNGVREYSQHIGLYNSATVSFDVPVTETFSGLTVYYECMYNHFGSTSYGSWQNGFFSFRSANNSYSSSDIIKDHGNAASGYWTTSLIGAGTPFTYMRFTKSAGTYGGFGEGHIFVRGGLL